MLDEMILPLPFIEFDGEQRFLAALAPKEDFGGLMKASAKMPDIPKDKWQETSADDFGLRILNQGQHGSCVGHGGCSGTELQWLRQGGEPVNFSACFLYGLINGGRDAGAIVSDAMQALMEQGICTENEVPPGQIYKRTFKPDAYKVASKYKIAKAYHVSTWETLVSEIIRGRNVVHGIMVGANYADLDSNGIAPLPRGGGGGHCQMSYAVRHINGAWVVDTRNSWGKSFGRNGNCYLTEQHFGRRGSLDAFSVEFVNPDANPNLPPMIQI